MSKPTSDVLIYLALASARDEELPEPFVVRVGASRAEPVLDVHVRSADDQRQWQEWFDRRRGADRWSSDEREVSGSRFHYTRTLWRGWKVELVYLTPAEPSEGGDRGE